MALTPEQELFVVKGEKRSDLNNQIQVLIAQKNTDRTAAQLVYLQKLSDIDGIYDPQIAVIQAQVDAIV